MKLNFFPVIFKKLIHFLFFLIISCTCYYWIEEFLWGFSCNRNEKYKGDSFLLFTTKSFNFVYFLLFFRVFSEQQQQQHFITDLIYKYNQQERFSTNKQNKLAVNFSFLLNLKKLSFKESFWFLAKRVIEG